MPYPEIYFTVACCLYVFTAFASGVARAGHFCTPYDEDKDYYYPARKEAVIAYFVPLMQLPYIFNPGSPEAWLLVRAFGVLYFPIISAYLILRYFNQKNIYRNKYVMLMTIPCIAVLLYVFVFSLFGSLEIGSYEKVVFYVVLAFSIIWNIYMAKIILWLKKSIDQYNSESYSNDEDFPSKFAIKIFWIPFVWAAVSWAIFLFDSRWIKVAGDVIFTVVQLSLLVAILRPNKKIMNIAAIIKSEEEEEILENSKIETEPDITLGESIKCALITKKLYLNPHLTLQDLADEVKSNRTYVSKSIKNNFGSFYEMVNYYRLDYAKNYQKNNPQATKEEISAASGFGSRKSFSRAMERFQ